MWECRWSRSSTPPGRRSRGRRRARRAGRSGRRDDVRSRAAGPHRTRARPAAGSGRGQNPTGAAGDQCPGAPPARSGPAGQPDGRRSTSSAAAGRPWASARGVGRARVRRTRNPPPGARRADRRAPGRPAGAVGRFPRRGRGPVHPAVRGSPGVAPGGPPVWIGGQGDAALARRAQRRRLVRVRSRPGGAALRAAEAGRARRPGGPGRRRHRPEQRLLPGPARLHPGGRARRTAAGRAHPSTDSVADALGALRADCPSLAVLSMPVRARDLPAAPEWFADDVRPQLG